MERKDILKKKIPEAPGVYFFIDARGKISYIGKAGSLRDRVRSYFSKDVVLSRSTAILQMIEEAQNVRWQETDSVLEALILEANLIKKHKPKYNVRERDDKSFNYVIITDEDFPKVETLRERELRSGKVKDPIKYSFGPFPQGGQLREALAIVRKIFPFRDKRCKPGSGKPCFNRQIGLCPGVCTGKMKKKEYARQVQNIKLLFEGRKSALIKKLEREMKRAAREENFERAAELRNTIFSLNHIQDIALLKNISDVDKPVDKSPQGRALLGLKNRGYLRIEAYDVAHLGGSEAVGVMTVVEGGDAKKSDYRKFKIRDSKTGGDVPALREILERRLAHSEWPLPRLIVVDGGKAQVNAAQKVLKESGIEIPVVGVVKDERHKPKRFEGARAYVKQFEKEILLANSEAHRFAITFHRTRMRKRL